MTFSCIIPAYNEWPRIKRVLEIVLSCPLLFEVIVVNDGSTDDTQEVIDSLDHPKLKKISQQNAGKAKAIFAWIHLSSWDSIVMIDSDLIGLKSEHITSLIEPIEHQDWEVTLSIRENSLMIYKWLRSDFVSGERVVPRTLLQENELYLTTGPWFGLEVKMNELIRAKGYRVKNVAFPGVITPRKSEKIGLIRGSLADAMMVGEILRSVSVLRILRQIWYFSRFHQS